MGRMVVITSSVSLARELYRYGEFELSARAELLSVAEVVRIGERAGIWETDGTAARLWPEGPPRRALLLAAVAHLDGKPRACARTRRLPEASIPAHLQVSELERWEAASAVMQAVTSKEFRRRAIPLRRLRSSRPKLDDAELRRAEALSAPWLLGGSGSPAACSVQFVEAPFAVVKQAHVDWRRGLGDLLEIVDGLRMPAALGGLEPAETPWTRELLIDCGNWTGYVNNAIGGGDPTASAGVTANALGARHIVAEHKPKDANGHASTQLWMAGPDGEPFSGHVRTIAATCWDGRWIWELYGTPQTFEATDRYEARLIRDRFDRALLLQYLQGLSIYLDEPSFFGEASLILQRVTWSRRKAQVRASI